jgi:transcriptional regulator with XRE-family HTH domain
MTISERDALVFGRTLCLTRCRRGLSQEALARQSGLGRDTIYKLESGIRSPTLGSVLALADALNVDPCELLKGLRP